MQTFAPYKTLGDIAKCLDYKRLNKQKIEAWQIYCAITDPNYGWQNHPVVEMWRGYGSFLIEYGLTMAEEWVRRGYRDNVMLDRFTKEFHRVTVQNGFFTIPKKPYWWGNYQFHASHRSNLLRKYPEHYSQFGWIEPNDLPYFWPTRELAYVK